MSKKSITCSTLGHAPYVAYWEIIATHCHLDTLQLSLCRRRIEVLIEGLRAGPSAAEGGALV